MTWGRNPEECRVLGAQPTAHVTSLCTLTLFMPSSPYDESTHFCKAVGPREASLAMWLTDFP